jgi:hypothetical protein
MAPVTLDAASARSQQMVDLLLYRHIHRHGVGHHSLCNTSVHHVTGRAFVHAEAQADSPTVRGQYKRRRRSYAPTPASDKRHPPSVK